MEDKKNYIGNLFNTIDNMISVEKEQKLRNRLGEKIKAAIFTEEIENRLNSDDFSGLGLLDNSNEEAAFLFSTLFPIFIEEDGICYRLYKHKIEVDLSDKMADRYIYVFSDGRLTSGLFQCFRLYDDEYVYGIKKIITAIPLLKQGIIEELDNLEEHKKCLSENLHDYKVKLQAAEENSKKLMELLK